MWEKIHNTNILLKKASELTFFLEVGNKLFCLLPIVYWSLVWKNAKIQFTRERLAINAAALVKPSDLQIDAIHTDSLLKPGRKVTIQFSCMECSKLWTKKQHLPNVCWRKCFWWAPGWTPQSILQQSHTTGTNASFLLLPMATQRCSVSVPIFQLLRNMS